MSQSWHPTKHAALNQLMMTETDLRAVPWPTGGVMLVTFICS